MSQPAPDEPGISHHERLQTRARSWARWHLAVVASAVALLLIVALAIGVAEHIRAANANDDLAAALQRETKLRADLQKTNTELDQALAKLRKTEKAAVTTVPLSAPNPPTFPVEGKVLDTVNDLVQISVGSDDGLLVGHTLDLFRLGQKPQSRGIVRLIRVEPRMSFGQLVKQPAVPPQRGDNVASKLPGE